MSKIPLTQGQFAIVDDWAFEFLSRWKWCVQHGYAARRLRGTSTIVMMHRQILGASAPGMNIDHINRDKLDNRFQNLRLVSPARNAQNSGRVGACGYRGVRKCKKDVSFIARIKISGKETYLGSFKTAVLAAKAYDRAALAHYGGNARVNFP